MAARRRSGAGFGVGDPEAVSATPQVTLTPSPGGAAVGRGPGNPDLPTPADLRLVEALTLAHPALSDARGWHVTFGRELNATDDRDCLRDGPATPGTDDLPVIEGRHLAPFRVDVSAARRHADAGAAHERLGGRGALDRPRLAYRDVASATNRTTLIAAIVPSKTVTVHTVFCLQTRLALDAQRVLCALLNSYVRQLPGAPARVHPCDGGHHGAPARAGCHPDVAVVRDTLRSSGHAGAQRRRRGVSGGAGHGRPGVRSRKGGPGARAGDISAGSFQISGPA